MKNITLLITCALIVTVMPCQSAQIVNHSGNYLFTTYFIHPLVQDTSVMMSHHSKTLKDGLEKYIQSLLLNDAN